MIKGKPSFPFNTIALGVAFNDELDFMVSEMKRHCENHGSLAVFIHYGKKTGDKFIQLSKILTRYGFHDGNSRIYWEQANAVSAILQICKHEVVDLLLMGLSQNKNFAQPFGKLTQEIATKAKCSVLVYASPSRSMKRIVIEANNHRKTEHALMTAFYFSEREKAEEVIVLDVAEQFAAADSSQSADYTSEIFSDSKFNQSIENMALNVRIESASNENFEDITEYAQKVNADLVIVNSIDHHLQIFERIAQNHIDTILPKLPCNLLIIHSRLIEE
ncbi:MAG: universal stress protein [Bacteroidetes bacterium]|nr:universal stress protein [Bacteroidota bacterium]MBP6427452.1 universal stress protein [Bacteroidia bacterium]MBK8362643.1 universal stress protein [Bacteroidota bacterium]MBK9412649.1 universal stress protein [Bacteroidota bacterium]MBL0032037.1 universal stress protein [Bacteroidota bacterium]